MIHKVIFLGTTHTARCCLDQLMNHSLIEVTAIITKPPQLLGRGGKTLAHKKILHWSPVGERAKALSLPLLTPTSLNDPAFLSQVRKSQAKWAVVLAYGKILPIEFLSLFPQRAFNFHASLLPRWRGAAPIQRAIMADDKKIGMTLQVIQLKLDTGAIVATRSFTLQDTMDANFVFEKMKTLTQDLLVNLLEYMSAPRKLSPQDETKAIYAHKINKKECLIIWANSARTIFNQIRALVTGPQAYTIYQGKRLKILSARSSIFHLKQPTKTCPPGQVIQLAKDFFTVTTKDTPIDIMRLQPESKKVMSTEEYLRGHPIKIGNILGEIIV